MPVKPVPDGFHTITPHLTIQGADRLMTFLHNAFDARERSCSRDGNGRIANAEMLIGDSIVMLAEATEKYPPMPAQFYLYVSDTDTTYQRGLQHGGISIMEPADQFYGDRSAGIQDPSGNMWWIATHIEDVSPDEMKRRMQTWNAAHKQ